MTERLGDYELVSEIGRGGMGRVFRARHVPTGAERALKLLEGGDAESVTRFRREAEALARVGPTVAVPVHEAGFDRGRAFYVMDLMSGGSLAARLAATPERSWKDAVELAAKLARAVARCHAVGLVHRDLKPANVLFGPSGLSEPRLADFGCARDLAASKLTATGTTMGTPGYMAPEQIDGRRGDERADVYALGVILHELLTGARPHEASRWHELLIQAKRGLPHPIAATVGAPAALDDVLRRALAFEASGRTPSAARLADELEGLLTGKLALANARRGTVVALSLVALALLVGLALAGGAISFGRPLAVPAPSPPAPSPRVSQVPLAASLDLLERQLRTGVAGSSGELAAIVSRSGGSDLLRKLAQDAVVLPLDAVHQACARTNAPELRWLEAVAVLASSRDAARRLEATTTLTTVPRLKGHVAEELGIAARELRALAVAAGEIRAHASLGGRDFADPHALDSALTRIKARPELVAAATAEIEHACRDDLVGRFDGSRIKPFAALFDNALFLEDDLGRLPHAIALAHIAFRPDWASWTTEGEPLRLRLAEATESEASALLEAGDTLLAADAYAIAFEHTHWGDPCFHERAAAVERVFALALAPASGHDRAFALRRLHDANRYLSSQELVPLMFVGSDEPAFERALRLALEPAEGALRHGRELLAEDSKVVYSDRAIDAHRVVAVRLALGEVDEARSVDLDPLDVLRVLRAPDARVADLERAVERSLDRKSHADIDRQTTALAEAIRVWLARQEGRGEDATKLESEARRDGEYQLARAVVAKRLPLGKK